MPGLIAEIHTLYEIELQEPFLGQTLMTVFKVSDSGRRIIIFRILIPTVDLLQGTLRYRTTSNE